MKTIFIVVARGFIMRNILRSGVLKYIKKANTKVIIFIHGKKDGYIPNYLKEEFIDTNTEIIALTTPRFGKIKNKLYYIFCKLEKWLVFSKNMWTVRKARTSDSRLWIKGPIFLLLNKFYFLKKIARYIEYKFFYHDCYESYFNHYKPDLVFSCSIVSTIDIAFMKSAKRRNIKTVSMPKGWDNITNRLYRFIPDNLIVQNKGMKKGAIKMQRIKRKQITVCGFPQFDWYRKPEIIMNREKYFSKIGLNPKRKLIFFGSEGLWIQNDENILKMLVEVINDDKTFIKPCNIFIRSHFSDAKTKRFDHYLGIKNIKVDDNFTFSDVFYDSCDPIKEEIIQFVNTIYHSDIIISFGSTLSLDACCFLKPNINPAFNVFFDKKTGKDISPMIYHHDHFQDVLETGAVDMVYSKKELFKSINNYLKNPDYKKENRQKLMDKMCYKVDGKSSKRIADVLLGMLKKN